MSALQIEPLGVSAGTFRLLNPRLLLPSVVIELELAAAG